MIRLDFSDWPSAGSIGPIESAGGPSLITGAAAPLPLGSFMIHGDPFAAAAPDDDPVTAAEGMRGSAQRALDLMRTTVSANRDLDNLMTSVIDAPDWRDGMAKFDKGLAELKQKHLPRFKDAESSTAFVRELEEFAAIRRIDLKSALARKQQDEALTGLDDTLAYYAQQAAAARHDTFREIAIERGMTAIDRMAAAGYLFPETAKQLEAAFHARVDAADVEAILAADPAEALKALDAGLFLRLDEHTRAKLREQAIAKIAQTDTPPSGVEVEYRDTGPGALPNPVGTSAASQVSTTSNQQPKSADSQKSGTDDLHGVGVGDGEIPTLEPLEELTDEEIERFEKLLDAAVLLSSFLPIGPYVRTLREVIRLARATQKIRRDGIAAPSRQPSQTHDHTSSPSSQGAAPRKSEQPAAATRPTEDGIPDDIRTAREKARTIRSTDYRVATPEGQQRIREHSDTLYGEGARIKGREAWIYMGRPGSGKSSLAEPAAKENGALLIDTDAAKQLIPEYQEGIGGAAVHREATAIRDNVLKRATKAGDNVVLPIVGSRAEDVQNLVRALKKAGFKVHIVHVDVPQVEGISRAYERYRTGGQFIDPDYMLSVGDKPKQNFDRLIEQGMVDSYAEFDNNVLKGQPPRQIRAGQAK